MAKTNTKKRLSRNVVALPKVGGATPIVRYAHKLRGQTLNWEFPAKLTAADRNQMIKFIDQVYDAQSKRAA